MMGAKVSVVVGLTVLLASTPALVQPTLGDPTQNWAAIVACGSTESAAKRHSCMDDILRGAGILSDAKLAREARQDFGKRPETAKSAAVAAPRSAPQAARGERIDQLVTTIKSASTVGFREWRVTTAEGSIWEQTQPADLVDEPRIGDGFAVEKASLGSYLCRFGRSKSYRCKRLD